MNEMLENHFQSNIFENNTKAKRNVVNVNNLTGIIRQRNGLKSGEYRFSKSKNQKTMLITIVINAGANE